MRRELDWGAIALTGDVGAVPDLRPIVAQLPRSRRPKALTAALLLAWLAWELGGIARVGTFAPPIAKAMWGLVS